MVDSDPALNSCPREHAAPLSIIAHSNVKLESASGARVWHHCRRSGHTLSSGYTAGLRCVADVNSPLLSNSNMVDAAATFMLSARCANFINWVPLWFPEADEQCILASGRVARVIVEHWRLVVCGFWNTNVWSLMNSVREKGKAHIKWAGRMLHEVMHLLPRSCCECCTTGRGEDDPTHRGAITVNRTPSHVTFSRVSQHTFQCRTWHWLKVSCARHPCVILMLLLSWYSSTLHSALFAVSLIFPFRSIFIFHVGWFDEKSHAYFREWGVRHNGREQPSHKLWAQLHRQIPHLRDYWHSHPGVRQSGARRSSEPITSLSVSWRKLVVQPSSVGHVRTGRLVFHEFRSLISNVRENPRRDSESEQIRILLERQREQNLAYYRAEIEKHEFHAYYDRRSIQKLNETIESQ